MAEEETRVVPPHRPTARPRNQSSLTSPPLPAKQNVYSERDVETRLGISRQAVTPPSPLPLPPKLTAQRLTPEPTPKSDEEVSPVVSKNSDVVQLDKSVLHPNIPGDVESTSSIPKTIQSSLENESLAVFPSDSAVNNQTEELQMRSKSPGSAETKGTTGFRKSHAANAGRVSQFVSAVEKASKPEKPPPVSQKPGRLTISDTLANKIADGLSRQQTLRAVQPIEEQPDVGIDRMPADSEVSPAAYKPSGMSPHFKKSPRSYNVVDSSEDGKSMLRCEVFSANL